MSDNTISRRERFRREGTLGSLLILPARLRGVRG